MGSVSSRVSEREAAQELLAGWTGMPAGREAAAMLEELFSRYLQPWCREGVQRTLAVYRSRAADRIDEAAEIESEVLLQMTLRLTTLRSEGSPQVQDLR